MRRRALVGLLLMLGALSTVWGDDNERAVAEAQVQEIRAYIYWYNLELGRLVSVKDLGDHLVGKIQKRHGQFPFEMKKTELYDLVEKERAIKDVVRELISWLSSGTDFEDFVFERLRVLTGQNIVGSLQWIEWYKVHAGALRWSESVGYLVTNN